MTSPQKLIAVDCETTGLDPQHEQAFEIAWLEIPLEPGYALPEPKVIRLKPLEPVIEAMHPRAAEVNRYHERTIQPGWKWDSTPVLKELHADLAGAHLLGAMPWFDADFLKRTFADYGMTPPKWHYHLFDIEAYAIGWLSAKRIPVPLPWSSDELAEMCGVAPPAPEERHTAPGDVLWEAEWYLHMERNTP